MNSFKRGVLALLLVLSSCEQSVKARENVMVLNASPKVVFIEDFLSEKECDALIAKALPRLERSAVVNDDTPGNTIHEARTSRGMFIREDLCDDLVKGIENRIAALTGIPVENGEFIQVVNYGVGQEYQPHYDFFDPEVIGEAACLQVGGQRVATIIMYLHTTEKGGETIFPEIDIAIQPKKGSAVLFYNCEPDGKEDPRTLHGGAPVLEGEKWIATKWLREKEYQVKVDDSYFSQAQTLKEFQILDELVSTYYRLGEYAKALDAAERLLAVGKSLASPELIANSYYKLSAAVRGQELFTQARQFAEEALRFCPDDKALRAKILFNAGAAECDDPEGNLARGSAYYQEALTIFTELSEMDYRQRILIRLGKVHLLQNEMANCWKVIEELKKETLQKRTYMHLCYLETQALQKEKRWDEARTKADEGLKIATELQAQGDIRRFEQIIDYHCQGV